MSEKPRRVTRNDVAKRAGVSPAVVSYVINKSKFVSEEKTAAVMEAIKELKYIPNFTARNLKTNKSMQIAFVCDNLRNDWLEEAEGLLFQEGYNVSHCYTRDTEDFIQMLIARQFDAVFMMSNAFSTAQLNELADAGMPVVIYKTRDYGKLLPGIATVVPDYKSGIEKSINYLRLRGHSRIAYVLPIRYKIKEQKSFRIQAYEASMKANGLEFREDFIIRNVETIEAIQNEAINLMLRSDPNDRPTAFVASTDYIGLYLVNAFKQLNLRVPEDVAVIGGDNTFLAEMVTPPLTSVDFSKTDFAKALTDTITDLIAGKEVEDKYLPVNLVIRGSV